MVKLTVRSGGCSVASVLWNTVVKPALCLQTRALLKRLASQDILAKARGTKYLGLEQGIWVFFLAHAAVILVLVVCDTYLADRLQGNLLPSGLGQLAWLLCLCDA